MLTFLPLSKLCSSCEIRKSLLVITKEHADRPTEAATSIRVAVNNVSCE